VERKIERAIVSVTDKSNLDKFAAGLRDMGVEIISTGGTGRMLREAGIPVRDISEVTGFPEILDGRVKTLHPLVHGGILARRDNPEHVQTMKAHGIAQIDMVVVNLYAFEKAVACPGCTLDEAMENIDIGGPTMLRAAAKNFRDVAVVIDPADYEAVVEEMRARKGALSLETRFHLAKKVFARTHEYDGAISRYLETVSLPD